MAKIIYSIFVEKVLNHLNQFPPDKVYNWYLQSDRWEELRLARLNFDNFKCLGCNQKATCVHHREYPQVLGEETIDTLSSFCKKCHGRIENRPENLEELKARVNEDLKEGSAKCPFCEQKIQKLNPHSMSAMNVHVMEEIAKLNNRGHDWIKAKSGDKIETPSGDIVTLRTSRVGAYANYCDLFGLLDSGGRRSGLYRINEDGLAFLSGKLSVPKTIYCQKGRVVERTHEAVYVSDVKGVIFDKAYWDNYAEIQVWTLR